MRQSVEDKKTIFRWIPPIVYPTVSIIGGYFLASFVPYQPLAFYFIFIVLFLSGLSALLGRYSLGLVFFAFAFFAYGFFRNNSPVQEITLPEHQQFATLVEEVEKEQENYLRCIGNSLTLWNENQKTWSDKRILLYIPKTIKVRVGDTVLVKRKILPLPSPAFEGAWDSRNYYSKKGVVGQMFIAEEDIEIRSYTGKNRAIRALFLEHLAEYDKKGILRALLLGYKGALEKSTEQSFRKAGIIHLLAISGFHIGLVFGLFYFLVQGLPKELRWLLPLLGIWLFVGLIEFPSSGVRAALMVSFWLIQKSIGRSYNSWSAYFLSAFCIVVVDPSQIEDLGFQFSYAAVAGILYWGPLFRNWKNQQWPKVVSYFYELVSVSLCAQLALMPLSLYYFGTLPLLFLIANCFAIPLVVVLMYITIPVFALSFLFKLDILWMGINGLVLLITKLTEAISNLPFAELNGLYLPLWLVALCIIGVLTFRFFYDKKLLVSGGFLILLAFGLAMEMRPSKPSLIIPNTKEIDFLHLAENKLLVVAESELPFYLKSSLQKSYSFKALHFQKPENTSLYWREYDVLFIKDEFSETEAAVWVVLKNENKPSWIYGLKVRPKKLVLSSGLSWSWKKYWKKWAQKENVPVWDVSEKGYFEFNKDYSAVEK